MAYKVTYQDPRDLDKRRAIGVLMPFNSDSVFVPVYNSLEAYKVNLYNFFLTEREERYLNPELGSGLMQYLFTQAMDEDNLRNIQETIRYEVNAFFPKLEITQVQIDEFPEENALQIDIHFKIKGTELEDNLVLDINR